MSFFRYRWRLLDQTLAWSMIFIPYKSHGMNYTVEHALVSWYAFHGYFMVILRLFNVIWTTSIISFCWKYSTCYDTHYIIPWISDLNSKHGSSQNYKLRFLAELLFSVSAFYDTIILLWSLLRWTRWTKRISITEVTARRSKSYMI